MRNILYTFGLASILAVSTFANGNANSFGLYCTDEVIKSVLPNTYKVYEADFSSVVFATPLKINSKTKMMETTQIQFQKPAGHEYYINRGLGDVGYVKSVMQYDFNKKMSKMINTSFFTCQGETIFRIDEENKWMPIPKESIENKFLQDLTRK